MESIKTIEQEIKLNQTEEKTYYAEDILNILHEGAELPPEIQDYIDAQTEFYIWDYFHHNNLTLFEGDYKIELTNNYRHNDILENINIELIAEYNALLNLLPADECYYFNAEPFYNQYSVEAEALDYLTYSIMQEYIETDNIKEALTDTDILTIISIQDKTHQEVIRRADTIELMENIKNAYNALITEIKDNIEEGIQEQYYNLYYQCEDIAIAELLEQTPVKLSEL